MAMEEPGDNSVTIRSFRRSDGPACRKLYSEGLLGGKLAENDTGADIDDIEAAYLRSPGNHFWVAVDQQGQVVGMIGVQHHEQGKAEIRRLRVREDLRHRREIGTRLLETALRFCQEQHYLKVTLDTFIERESAIKLFEKFHFRLDRARSVSGKDLLYFYLDLYGAEKRKG
ncbi:GNAT family N-acetyltransferase [Fontivita pretiosa]|uniref:GNAT family N-acetyltransferase n=1 Tax=Fontivita pretiosa TaxID=2989684 RepID=UPI003D175D10